MEQPSKTSRTFISRVVEAFGLSRKANLSDLDRARATSNTVYEQLNGAPEYNFSYLKEYMEMFGLAKKDNLTRDSKEVIGQNKRVDMKKLRKVAFSNSLVQSIINFKVNSVLKGGFEVESDNEELESFAKKWVERVRLRRHLEETVRTWSWAGNDPIELGISRNKKDIPDLFHIAPETFDFVRNSSTRVVETDSLGYPKDFVQRLDGTFYGPERKLDKERIVHTQLFEMGQAEMGIGYVELAWKDIITHGVLLDSRANAAYRKASPMFIVKIKGAVGTAGKAAFDEAQKTFAKSQYTTFATIPEEWDPQYLQTDLSGLLEMSTEAGRSVCMGFNVPPQKFINTSGTTASENMDFELDIISLRERLVDAYQPIFDKLASLAGFGESKFTLKFKNELGNYERSQTLKDISEVTKAGLLTPTPEVENEVRRALNLPKLEIRPNDKLAQEDFEEDQTDTEEEPPQQVSSSNPLTKTDFANARIAITNFLNVVRQNAAANADGNLITDSVFDERKFVETILPSMIKSFGAGAASVGKKIIPGNALRLYAQRIAKSTKRNFLKRLNSNVTASPQETEMKLAAAKPIANNQAAIIASTISMAAYNMGILEGLKRKGVMKVGIEISPADKANVKCQSYEHATFAINKVPFLPSSSWCTCTYKEAYGKLTGEESRYEITNDSQTK